MEHKKTAVRLKRNYSAWTGHARLYRLSHPIAYSVVGEDTMRKTRYVIVSDVHAMFAGPETLIFPAHKNGDPINMIDVEGSVRGVRDHAQALRNAGYEIVEGK